jgi:hypothetical protein
VNVITSAINVTVVVVASIFGAVAMIVTTIAVGVSTVYVNKPLSKVQFLSFPSPSALSVGVAPEVQVALSVIFLLYARVSS